MSILEARWLVLRDTKNGTDRGVPIHRQLVEVLTGFPSAAAKQGSVFLTDRGNPLQRPQTRRRRGVQERLDLGVSTGWYRGSASA
jgi:integrase